MNSTSKKLIDALKICVIALALTLGVNYVFAWVGAPSGGPTNCPAGHVGCDAPINVSTSAQTKNGQLTVTNLWGSFVGSTAGGYFATRLGIGPNASTSGSATLDVDGTVQIRGGSPASGKVLVASDANGNATWQTGSASGGGFTNFQVFDTPGITTWTAPAGVTRVMVEAWGAGGAGNKSIETSSPYAVVSAGGGAGGYGKGIYTVVPGTEYSITVGGGFASGPGTSSSFGSLLLSYGGGAGVSTPIDPDYNNHISGSNIFFNDPAGVSIPAGGVGGTSNGAVSIKGGNGNLTRSLATVDNSSNYQLYNHIIAQGGDAPNGGSGGVGTIATYDQTWSGKALFSIRSTAITAVCDGDTPGGGGAGGYVYPVSSNTNAISQPSNPPLCPGGNGRVIVWY